MMESAARALCLIIARMFPFVPGCVITITALALSTGPSCSAGWLLDVESGAAFPGYNDVQIPGDSGTRFSLTDDLSTDAAPFIRLRIGRLLGEKHHLSAFAAPLRLSAGGTLDKPIDYEGTRFPDGTDLEATYRFDSYRLTYRYRILCSPSVEGWIGLTAKIRDAEILLSSDDAEATKKNTGLVPLLAFSFKWRFNDLLCGILEGDALAGGPGRAEDVFVGLGFTAAPRVAIRIGYRILEGGADVQEVYNFALIHYASLGLAIDLGK